MHVLLDECVPRGLRQELSGHEVKTVAEMGWAGIKNGALLERAEKIFDVFLTVDRGLEHQQNLAGYAIAVVVIHSTSNDIAVLRSLMPRVRSALARAKPGAVTHVSG
jgi:hypothetical protein